MNEHFVARNECPGCGSGLTVELCRAPYSQPPLRQYLIDFYSPQGKVDHGFLRDQDYVLRECMDCGLIYQGEIPGDSLMRKVYEEWIDPRKSFDLYERTRGINSFAVLSAEIIEIVRLFDRAPMELAFLDFSMGWGHWCRIAQSFGCAVHGTEFSPSRIEYARSTGVRVISYAEIASHRYDFINTEQVFEHLPEIRASLAYLKGSLKPGGLLKISVPDGADIKRRLKVWDWRALKNSPDSLNPVAPLEHINCFHHAALVRLAAGAGLVPYAGPPAATRPCPGGFAETAKALLRPYWRRLKRANPSPANRGTSMLFQDGTALHPRGVP